MKDALCYLKRYDLIYVGTPYSKYPGGIDVAFEDASRLTAKLMQRGLKVYSPIAHTHPLAIYGDVDPMNHEIWFPFDAAMMAKSDAMIVLMMDTWDQSYGVDHEIKTFEAAGKPIYYITTDLEFRACPPIPSMLTTLRT